MYFSTSPWKGCTSTFMVLHPGHSGGQAVSLTLAAGPRPVSAHLLSAGCLCLAPGSRGLGQVAEGVVRLQLSVGLSSQFRVGINEIVEGLPVSSVQPDIPAVGEQDTVHVVRPEKVVTLGRVLPGL